jgi:hypothetical protein
MGRNRAEDLMRGYWPQRAAAARPYRLDAVRARLHEWAGHPCIAAEHYTRAAARARHTAERDYLTKQAVRLRHR